LLARKNVIEVEIIEEVMMTNSPDIETGG